MTMQDRQQAPRPASAPIWQQLLMGVVVAIAAVIFIMFAITGMMIVALVFILYYCAQILFEVPLYAFDDWCLRIFRATPGAIRSFLSRCRKGWRRSQ
jgi:uncharacterized membrane protein HdeD (DUF308 family)